MSQLLSHILFSMWSRSFLSISKSITCASSKRSCGLRCKSEPPGGHLARRSEPPGGHRASLGASLNQCGWWPGLPYVCRAPQVKRVSSQRERPAPHSSKMANAPSARCHTPSDHLVEFHGHNLNLFPHHKVSSATPGLFSCTLNEHALRPVI